MPKTITVSMTVNLDGEEKTFTTTASTDGDVYDVAHGNISGIAGSAGDWVHATENAARQAARAAGRRTPAWG